MKIVLWLLTVLVLNVEAGSISYKIPAISELEFSQQVSPSRISFSGQTSISGKYHFIFERHRESITFYFYPDKRSLETLPYLTVFSMVGVAKEILIENSEVAAEKLLGTEDYQLLASGEEPYYTGEATITITNLFAGNECESSYFTADFVKQINVIKSPANDISPIPLDSYKEKGNKNIRVEFGFDDIYGLIPQLKGIGYDAMLGDECCVLQWYHESLSVWIGRKVPLKDVKIIMLGALNSYPQLSYFKYSGDDSPDKVGHTIYIGGSTWVGKHEVKAVSSENAKILFEKIESKAELTKLLNSFERYD